jgi:hypothetical protein
MHQVTLDRTWLRVGVFCALVTAAQAALMVGLYPLRFIHISAKWLTWDSVSIFLPSVVAFTVIAIFAFSRLRLFHSIAAALIVAMGLACGFTFLGLMGWGLIAFNIWGS